MKAITIIAVATIILLAISCSDEAHKDAISSRFGTAIQSDSTGQSDSIPAAFAHRKSGAGRNTKQLSVPSSYKTNQGGIVKTSSLVYGSWVMTALSEMRRIDIEEAQSASTSAIVMLGQRSSELDKIYGSEAYGAILSASDEYAQKHAQYFAKNFTINPVAVDSLLRTGVLPESVSVFIKRR